MNITTTELRLIIRAFCRPINVRTKRSRPSWSVPSTCFHAPPCMKTGGVNFAMTDIFVADWLLRFG